MEISYQTKSALSKLAQWTNGITKHKAFPTQSTSSSHELLRKCSKPFLNISRQASSLFDNRYSKEPTSSSSISGGAIEETREITPDETRPPWSEVVIKPTHRPFTQRHEGLSWSLTRSQVGSTAVVLQQHSSNTHDRAQIRSVRPSCPAPLACQSPKVLDSWDDTPLYTVARSPVSLLGLDRAHGRNRLRLIDCTLAGQILSTNMM